MFVVFKIVIFLAALAYLFWDIEFVLLKDALRKYDLLGILLAQGSIFLSLYLVAYRLRYLTKAHITHKAAFEASMFGLGINNILPAKLGELAKGVYLDRIYGYPLSKSLALIVVERIFDVLMLLIFALSLSYFVEVANIFTLLFIFFVLLILLFVVVSRAQFFIKLVVLYAPGAGKKFLTTSIKTVARITKKEWSVLFWQSLVIWSSYLLLFFIFDAFGSHLGLDFEMMLAAFVFSALGMTIPSTPGNIGVFEAGMVFGLGLYGIQKEDAFVFALFVHLFQMVPTVLYSFYLSFTKKIDLKMIKNRA